MFSDCGFKSENPDPFNNFGKESASLTVTAGGGSKCQSTFEVNNPNCQLQHDHAVSVLGNSGQKGVYGL